MTTLLAPDAACVEITAPSGLTYKADHGRYEVADDADAKAMRKAGCFVPVRAPRTPGRRCDCGFVGYFIICGRCGGETRRV
jgi:hypothetical protein